MSRTLSIVCLPVVFVAAATAQYGTAPNNYYPDKYRGSIFTGTMANAKDDQLTLTHTKGSKVETFTGRIEAPCAVPSTSGRAMMPSDIPKGTMLTAFFNTETRKANGQKVKENVILAISFDVWQGQKIAEDRKRIYFCTNDRHVQFRAWGN